PVRGGRIQGADGKWVAISTSAESVAHGVLGLLGMGGDARFGTLEGRAAHRDELDAIVAKWIAARPSAEVLAAFEDAHAAIAPVYSMHDLLADPHVMARHVFIDVDGVVMQAPVARMSRTPGHVRWAGRELGADTEDVLAELDDQQTRERPEEGW